MVDPASLGGRRHMRTPHSSGGRGASDSSCDGCDLNGCDLNGCDLPCDFFQISLLGLLALRTPHRGPRQRVSAPALAGIAAIRAYQRVLSPRLPTSCRQIPSCSGYGIQAVRRYGLATGVRLTADRISRCTTQIPRGTVDPVP